MPYCIFPLPHGNVLIILLYHAHRHFFHPMPFSLPQSGSPAVLMTAHVRQHPLTLLPHCHPPLTAAHEFLRTVRRRLPRLYMPDNACQDGFADGHILLPVHFCAVRRSVLPFPAPAFPALLRAVPALHLPPSACIPAFHGTVQEDSLPVLRTFARMDTAPGFVPAFPAPVLSAPGLFYAGLPPVPFLPVNAVLPFAVPLNAQTALQTLSLPVLLPALKVPVCARSHSRQFLFCRSV